MTVRKQWLCLILCMTLSAALVLPTRGEGAVAEFYIDAQQVDTITQEVWLALHTRQTDGTQEDTTLVFDTPVNRLTGDGAAYLIPQTAGVAVTVDRLTDPDGDGVYALTADELSPGWEYLSPEGALVPAGQGPVYLEQGETYALSAATLTARSAGAWDATLYLITVSPGSEQELCYYLRVCDGLPLLSVTGFGDVQPGRWYYGAVDYVLSSGLMSGTGTDAFAPEAKLSRAMLAQILYAIADKPAAADTPFADVAKTDWFSSAASWADAQGLMHGTGDGIFNPNAQLTRQQLALVLLQYARAQGGAVSARADLSGYADGGSVAGWAREAMEWAVASALLSPNAGKLNPDVSVTRGEMAGVLRTLWENILG